jgi:hypothetical protein
MFSFVCGLVINVLVAPSGGPRQAGLDFGPNFPLQRHLRWNIMKQPENPVRSAVGRAWLASPSAGGSCMPTDPTSLALGVLLLLTVCALLGLRERRCELNRQKAESALQTGLLHLAESHFDLAGDPDGLARVGERYLDAEKIEDAYRAFSRAGRTDKLRFFAEETRREVCAHCSGAGERYLSSDEASALVPWNMCDYSRGYEIGQLTQEAMNCPDCRGSGYRDRIVKVFSTVVHS